MAQFKQYLKSCTAAFKVKLPGQSTGRGCAVVLDLIKWYYDDDCDCGDDKTKFHDFQVQARVVGVEWFCGDGMTKFHDFL